MACETPTSFSAQHHAMLHSCIHHSWFPPQPAARWEQKAPCPSMGAGLLAEMLFILKREHKHFLKCKYAFSNASCPKALLLAIDASHAAGPKPFTRNLLGKDRRRASHRDGGQPEMLPQPLCMLTTALSSVILQALLGVLILHMM